MHIFPGYYGDIGGVEALGTPSFVAHQACTDDWHSTVSIAGSHTTFLQSIGVIMANLTNFDISCARLLHLHNNNLYADLQADHGHVILPSFM